MTTRRGRYRECERRRVLHSDRYVALGKLGPFGPFVVWDRVGKRIWELHEEWECITVGAAVDPPPYEVTSERFFRLQQARINPDGPFAKGDAR